MRLIIANDEARKAKVFFIPVTKIKGNSQPAPSYEQNDFYIGFSDEERYQGAGVQEWHSSESTRLPPMWAGFDSQTQRYMWVEFVGSLLCTERLFSGFIFSWGAGMA